jgi:hypothetical protein
MAWNQPVAETGVHQFCQRGIAAAVEIEEQRHHDGTQTHTGVKPVGTGEFEGGVFHGGIRLKGSAGKGGGYLGIVCGRVACGENFKIQKSNIKETSSSKAPKRLVV